MKNFNQSFLQQHYKLLITIPCLGIVGNVTVVKAAATWSSTGSMITARAYAATSLLSDGKLLIVGGKGHDGLLASTELYNPNTGTWSQVGELTTARMEHTATRLQNGKVLVVGGKRNSSLLASAELFNPVTTSWSSTSSMSVARRAHTAILLPNGKVLVTGGEGSNKSLNSAELYDPITNVWGATGAMIKGRERHTAVLFANDTKVLVAGGFNRSTGDLATAEIYTINTGQWTATGSMNKARERHTASLLGTGKVLVAGGAKGVNYLNSAELYDPATGVWTNTGNLVTARSNHTAITLASGKSLVVGGWSGSDYLGSAERYEPVLETWTSVDNTTRRFVHNMDRLADGKILITGGWRDGTIGFLSSTKMYSYLYTVTPTAGVNGSVIPNTPQTISDGEKLTLTVTPNNGYTHNTIVGGTCPQGSWNGNNWITGAIIDNCTVNFSFNSNTNKPTVITGTATNITPTTATLNGSVTSNGATATVNFNFGTTTDYGQTIAAVPAQINSNTAVTVTAAATGLICNTTYHYRITAVNSAGSTNGTDQSLTTATCHGTTVNPPTTVTVNPTNITPTSATLNGMVNANGATTTVTFDFGLTTSYGTSITAVPSSINATAGTTLVSTNKTDLTCNTTYNYRINAVNSAGTSLGTNQNFITGQCTTNYQANLESPQQGSYESGIGLIRGWACQANTIEIQIDNGTKRKVAYGTARGDTQTTCGHSNTGFGFTYNWNELTNGTHSLKVFADNVQFADVNFTTTNLGTSYLTGASGQHTVTNFPSTGKSATLKWSEPHQNFVIVSATRIASKIMPSVIRTGITGNLESPQQNSFESGIGLIRGWVCQANSIELQIDGGTRRPVAYGTARGDTAATCNGNPNTGFGYVYNWNALGDGNHNLRLFVDNQEFTNVNFTVTTLGSNYLEDLSRDETFNFNGKNIKVRWATPHQNFVIVP